MRISIETALEFLNQALEVAESIVTSSDSEESLKAIASVMGKIDSNRAVQISKRIASPGRRAATLASVAMQLVDTNSEQAKSLFTQSIDLVNTLSEEYHSSKVEYMCDIASKLAKIAPKQSEALLDNTIKMIEKRRDDDQVLQAAELRRAAGALAKVDVHRALELANTIGDSAYKAMALADVAVPLVELDVERANSLFDEALRLVERGKSLFDEALKLADPAAVIAKFTVEDISATSRRGGALSAIAIHLAKVDAKRALQVAKRAGVHEKEALASIATALTRSDPVKACELAEEIKEQYAVTETDPVLSRLSFNNVYTTTAVSDVAALASIAIELEKLDVKKESARTFLAAALGITERISDPERKDFALCELAGRVSKVDIDHAYQLATQIEYPEIRTCALATMAAVVCELAGGN